MHRRAVRFTLLALLVASGVGAALSLRHGEQRVQALEDRRRSLDAVVDRVAPAIAGIEAAQQAYVDYGLRDEASFVRVASLIQRLRGDAAGLRASDYSGAASGHLGEFWTALSALTSAETQAADAARIGDSLAAADLLFGAARPHARALASELQAFRDTETSGLRNERAALTRQAWTTMAAVGLLWLGGLFALAGLPGGSPRRQPPPEVAALSPAVSEPEPARVMAVDLAATAALCSAITQTTDTKALPSILERAARIIDARGIIIWMGAGDDLFPATAFGYHAAILKRVRPIRRSADNATAAAWRTGTVRTVAADAGGLGAIAAPMFAGRDCIGVLAAEVHGGRERDAATAAVTAIVASQMAGILEAWPAASKPAHADEAAPPAADSDRQTAAF